MKVEQLRMLAEQASSMSRDEQDTTSEELAKNVGTLRDTILRRETVLALGAFPTQHAATGLHQAAEDEEPQVRIAAAEAWGIRHDGDAETVLTSMVANDSNVDVRLAAIRSLAAFHSDEVVRQLGLALKDRDPAIQLAAIHSLKSATGKDLGTNVNHWIAHIDATVNLTEKADASGDLPFQVAQPPVAGSTTR